MTYTVIFSLYIVSNFDLGLYMLLSGSGLEGVYNIPTYNNWASVSEPT